VSTTLFEAAQLAPVASTGIGGYTLTAGGGTVPGLAWTAPSDGNTHYFCLFSELAVSSAESGGAITVSYTDPGGTARTQTPYAAALGAGAHVSAAGMQIPVAPGSTVTFSQAALTGGAAILYATLWAA
jgi:hypothetical protein